MSLTRPLDEWPLLICGPVLRRVTPDEVAVFIATKVSCDVQLLVGSAGSDVPSWVNLPTRTRALGQSLHVVVGHLTMPVGEKLVSGTLYEYDLRMTPPDTGVTETLRDQSDLLTGAEPLGYAVGDLPTFALPPGRFQLNLLHSSCRKPHGGGPDSLAMVDRLILRSRDAATVAGQARQRPHHLLLTGDQIYADDVALSMLSTLQEAGGLLGAQSPEEAFADGVLMTAAQVKPGTAREAFLKAKSELSSDEGMNHLMFFAEFCAMYVMCWSDELWPRDAQGKLQVGVATVEPKLAGQNNKERKELIDFVRTVRRGRRALANVPTMMMFDDHEISDDWNLDKSWVTNSRDNAVQHQVVRNGLLAYAVFQGWGNEPSRFVSDVPQALLNVVTIPDGDTVSPILKTPDAADVPLNLTTDAGPRMTWNWTLDGSEHRVIALDTRTGRDYVSMGPNSPGLLTDAELQRQLTANRPKDGDDKLCFVIAPAPVVGHPIVEKLLQPAMALYESLKNFDRIKGGRAADNEAWCVNRITYQAVLRRLAEFGQVVVLSGDVHYGSTNHTAYFGPDGLAPARIVQLCSSAGKNAERKTRAIQLGGYLGQKHESWLGFATPLSKALIFTLLAALVDPVMTTVSPIRHNLISRIRLFGLFETPAVVPAGPWHSIPAFLEVKRLTDLADPHDWRYRVSFVEDVRGGPERRATAHEIDPHPTPIGADHLIRHGHKAVVGEPNIGQVRLRVLGGKPVVEHRLHWMTSADPVDSAQTCTLHIVPLSQPGMDERPEPFL